MAAEKQGTDMEQGNVPPPYPDPSPPQHPTGPPPPTAGYPQYPAGPPPAGAQPPPPPGVYGPQYAPQQPGGTSVVIAAPTVVVGGTSQFGRDPIRINCPHCQNDVLTQVTYEIGGLAWIICGSIALVGLVLPCVLLGCCFIPFCINDCKDVVHHCPGCKQTLSRVSRLR